MAHRPTTITVPDRLISPVSPYHAPLQTASASTTPTPRIAQSHDGRRNAIKPGTIATVSSAAPRTTNTTEDSPTAANMDSLSEAQGTFLSAGAAERSVDGRLGMPRITRSRPRLRFHVARRFEAALGRSSCVGRFFRSDRGVGRLCTASWLPAKRSRHAGDADSALATSAKVPGPLWHPSRLSTCNESRALLLQVGSARSCLLCSWSCRIDSRNRPVFPDRCATVAYRLQCLGAVAERSATAPLALRGSGGRRDRATRSSCGGREGDRDGACDPRHLLPRQPAKDPRGLDHRVRQPRARAFPPIYLAMSPVGGHSRTLAQASALSPVCLLVIPGPTLQTSQRCFPPLVVQRGRGSCWLLRRGRRGRSRESVRRGCRSLPRCRGSR
jgi:hypothetical protein